MAFECALNVLLEEAVHNELRVVESNPVEDYSELLIGY